MNCLATLVGPSRRFSNISVVPPRRATDDPEDAIAAIAEFDFSQPTSPRLVGFRRQLAFDVVVVSPSGNNLFFAADNLVEEYNNSLPYNSIELFEPLAALAQSFGEKRQRGPSTAYLHLRERKLGAGH